MTKTSFEGIEIPVIRIFSKVEGQNLGEFFGASVMRFAKDVDINRRQIHKALDITGVAAVNFIGMSDLTLDSSFDLIEETRRRGTELTREDFEGIYVTNSKSYIGTEMIDALIQETKAEALNKYNLPEKFVNGDVSRMNAAKMERYIDSQVENGATVFVLKADNHILVENGEVTISDDIKSALEYARGKNVKMTIIIDSDEMLDSNGNFVEMKPQALLNEGFDGISVGASDERDSEKVTKILKGLNELSKKHAVGARNTAHIDESIVIEDIGQYDILTITEFNENGELKVLSAKSKKAAAEKGVSRALNMHEKEDISLKNDNKSEYERSVAAIERIVTNENISIEDFERNFADIVFSDQVIQKHIAGMLMKAKKNPAMLEEARTFLMTVYELQGLQMYMDVYGLTNANFSKNASSDKDALRKLIAVLRITDSTKDNFKNTETLKTFFENNKELLEDFDRDATVNQMRVDVNPIINSIIEENEFVLSPIKDQEKTRKVLKALAVVDMSVDKVFINKLLKDSQNAAVTSADAVRRILSAA